MGGRLPACGGLLARLAPLEDRSRRRAGSLPTNSLRR
jgi:hypothetical protein